MKTGQAQVQFGRRSTRLEGVDYSNAGGYYVTIVTLWRECLFGEVVDGEMQVNSLGKIVQECWAGIPTHFLTVDTDAFVVMPNHVHGIIFIHEDVRAATNSLPSVGARHVSPLHISPLKKPPYPPHGFKPGSIGAIVASFKSSVTRRAGRELNSGNIWQRNYYEHILRDQADYERIAGYILDNPLNWEKDEENPNNPVLSGNPPARDRIHRSGH